MPPQKPKKPNFLQNAGTRINELLNGVIEEISGNPADQINLNPVQAVFDVANNGALNFNRAAVAMASGTRSLVQGLFQ